MPRVPLDRFGSAPACLPQDAEVARVHHGTGPLDFREERCVQLLEVVPRHARVDVVADVVVDVVPEENLVFVKGPVPGVRGGLVEISVMQ